MPKAKSDPTLARRNALARYMFDAYPGNDLQAFDVVWDSKAGVPHNNIGDGLLEFMFEEVYEVVNYEGSLGQAVEDADHALNRAVADMDAVRHAIGKLDNVIANGEPTEKQAVWPELQ